MDNKKLRKVKYLLILFIIIICISIANKVKATEDTFSLPKLPDSYKKWMNLSDEERKNTLEPLPYNIKWKESVKKSTYNNLMNTKVGDSLASSYKISGLTVRNQMKTGLCWAFSFSSVLESTGRGKLYSPAFLDYKSVNMFTKKQGEGANYYVALATATSGNSPVLENEMPFENFYNEKTNTEETKYMTPIGAIPTAMLEADIKARISNATFFANITKTIDANKNITYSDGTNRYTTDRNANGIPDEVEAIRTQIKEHIKEKGAVTSNVYMKLAITSDGKVTSEDGYYNEEHAAFFCNDATKVPNHAVTIVGWDDNYEVTNFPETIRPKNPGAYIILNSYGEEVGEKGYMYVSYEDVLIENSVCGIDDLQEYEDSKNMPHDNLYQYDELGANNNLILNSEYNSAFSANVFSRDASKAEYLTEVGIYMLVTQGVEVYINPSSDDKTKLTKVAVETEDITSGYHIIKLSNSIKLTGDKFVVAVKYTNKESGVQIPVEMNLKETGITKESTFWDKAKADLGESFVSIDNGKTWLEINNLTIDTYKIKNTNACIKAYTVNTAPANYEDNSDPNKGGNTEVKVTGISLNSSEIEIEVGEEFNLVATITPKNATNQNVSWKSSETTVATVSSTGIIKPLKEGTTTISVTTADGGFVAKCNVIVSKATDSSDDIYNSDDDKDTMNNPKDKISSTITDDDTISSNRLPNTGMKTVMIISVIGLSIYIIFAYIKCKKLKDIK